MSSSRTEENDKIQSNNNEPNKHSSGTRENDETKSKSIEPNQNMDPEFERWMQSTFTMLGSIGDQEIEACSISIVPEHLRKSNREAYMPKVVSIGPLHTTETELICMKEIKWHYMLSLLRRVIEPSVREERLKECGKAMCGLDELFRGSYVDDLKLIHSYDLAKIMLVDGCFLLELLIRNNDRLQNELKCQLNSPDPRAKLPKKEAVLLDLMVLENQIPLYVLNMLSTLLFPTHFTKEDGKRLVKNLVLSLFGYNSKTVYKATHLLELLHSCVTGNLDEQEAKTEDKPSSSASELTIDMKSKQVEQSTGFNKSHENLELKRCARKLQAAGEKYKRIFILKK